jgi:hypothetical protein
MSDLTSNLKAPKPTAMQDHKTVTLGQGLDALDAPFKGFITGLGLEWVSASSIKVKTGAAVMPGGGLTVVGADITKTGVSLGVSVWGHVYLYDGGGVAAVEVVTTAPSYYFGTAYQKSTDATRRYLGSVKTDGSGNILNFLHTANVNFIRYRSGPFYNPPFRALSGGTATAESAISAAASVPVTSRLAQMRLQNTSATAILWTGTSDDSITVPGGGVAVANPSTSEVHTHPLDSTQTFTYAFSAAPGGGSAYGDVLGYWFDR